MRFLVDTVINVTGSSFIVDTVITMTGLRFIVDAVITMTGLRPVGYGANKSFLASFCCAID